MKHTLRTLLLAIFAIGLIQPIFGQVGIGVSVSFGPPALPVYDLPPCPGDGYLWTPGYWAYDDDDGYYWVPGTWVMAPEPGLLWTPGWWGWENAGFLWHEGFWGPEVGFYGGINYGFGYFGEGFYGGRWQGGQFFYNTAVLNVNVTNIHNVYQSRVDEHITDNHVSYNGGEGGVTARPSEHDQQVAQGRHIPPSSAQTQHAQAARSNPQMRAEANHGKPPIAATSRPGQFSGSGVVQAKQAGGEYKPAPARGAEGGARPGATNGARPADNGARPAETPNGERPSETPAQRTDNPTHAKDLQPHTVQQAPSSGDPRADLNYQKQQQKLVEQQNKEHQKLQQQQEKEDQAAAKKNMDAQHKQQMEQKHQQQTQQMEQRHSQQQQQMQQRAPAPRQAAPRKPE